MQAILTESWEEAISGAHDAEELCRTLQQNPKEGIDALVAASDSADKTLTVMALDSAFRRRKSGFKAIKLAVTTLISHEEKLKQHDIDISCGCNALVYAFLVGAKNFDFVFPESIDRSTSTFRTSLPGWKSTIRELEAFERMGDPLSDTALKDSYLCVRPIMTRSSARDEHRALCTLLMSGPSTMEEITEDLDLPYTLSERAIWPFISAGIVGNFNAPDRYAIEQRHIPLALFLVRETLGVDPLTILGN